jgi:hypothetical protein
MVGQSATRTIIQTALLLGIALASGVRAQQGGGVAQGVYVDADGVLRTFVVGEGEARQGKKQRPTLGHVKEDYAGRSELRKVSLAGLAREVKECLASGKPIPDEVRFLGGLTQIQNLFVYPDHHDVVIAGPAEGWKQDAAGRVVGQQSNRPVLQLEDLVTALRVFPPAGDPRVIVGCTINQTAEGVRNLNQFLASLGASVDRRQINAALVQRVRDSLGMQNIEVWGVPPDSRMAMVLVEADYRMKLIGIGLENPRVRGLSSYYALLGPGDGGLNKLQRWWFVPEYDAIVESREGTAFEFSGQRAKLVGADDRLQASGAVERGDSASGTTRRFAQSFSAHFQELARVHPAYADMQNAFDWVVVAALIQQRDMIRKVAPELAYFLQSEGGVPLEQYPVPRQVESVVNAKWIGSKLAIPVGGGVVLEPTKVLGAGTNRRGDSELTQRHRTAGAIRSSPGWCWD